MATNRSLFSRTAVAPLGILLLAVVCIAVAGPALAQSAAQSAAPGSARASLEAFSRDMNGLQAEFTQLIISSDGEVLEQGTGHIWIRRPNQFRWQYGGDFPELIVADGAQVWIYDESLEQVTVRGQSGMAADSPLVLLTDLTGLDEQFHTSELGEVAGLKLLELTSPDPDAQFERVLLGWQGAVLKTMVLEDAFGMRTELSFDTLQRNPELTDELFQFTPPDGVDVVGDLPELDSLDSSLMDNAGEASGR